MEAVITTPVEQKPRLWRRWLVYSLRALWVLNALFIAQLLIFSVRPGFAKLTQVCTEPECLDIALTPLGLANINALGVSVQSFALFQIFLVFAVALAYAGVALLIFRARYNDPVALYIALVLLNFGTFTSEYTDILREVHPSMTPLVNIMPGVTLIAFAILCYIFPDGHFVPRWTRWATATWIAVPFFLWAVLWFDIYDATLLPLTVVVLTLLASCIISPVYRYRKLSSRAQRQQLKWVLFGLTQLLFMMLFLVELLPFVFPALDMNGSLPNLISVIIQAISLIIFPITVGISLLRYRLWNVDLVINRTLVYIPLTSILTVIYTSSIAISQKLFASATGDDSQAVAIFTTIVLTTTFTPIKNALQSYVDKHFKEAPNELKNLRELDSQLTQVIQVLDHPLLARRVVDTIVQAHQAMGAALYLNEGKKMVLAYATPDWQWAEGEVSILLQSEHETLGRLLLGRRRDRDDYTLDEIDEIHDAALPVVRNMLKLAALQDGEGKK